MTSPMDLLVEHLQTTLTGSQDQISAATSELEGMKSLPGFCVSLLELLTFSEVPLKVRQAAAILMKNTLTRHWNPDVNSEDTFSISDDDKQKIKENILSVMVSSEPVVRRPLSDIVAKIAESDFPQSWSNLVPDLISNCSDTNMDLLLGVLETANAVFKRYRFQMESDSLFEEILFVVKNFQEPMKVMVEGLVGMLDSCAQDMTQLTSILGCLRLLMRIWFSLNWQDLAFENDHEFYVKQFACLLQYTNPFFNDEDDENPGPVEYLKSAVLENVNLLYEKYADEFEEQLQEFVGIVWHLLTALGPQTRFDRVISGALTFLTTVAKSIHHTLFAGEETLRQICENVVIPNLRLRDDDIELFFDSPVEYIQKDIEESDSETRRRTAFEFVQSLLMYFEKEVSTIFSEFLDVLLKTYASNPNEQWVYKDVAIFLVTAMSVKRQTMRFGASEISDFVNVMEFMASHIIPELESERINDLPILKADCIRFISTFRNQIPGEHYVYLLNMFVKFLGAEAIVLHTYAAACIDRLLSVRDGTTFRLEKKQLAPLVSDLLAGLIHVISPSNCTENEYAMRCILRITSMMQEDMAQYAELLIESLKGILSSISRNPRIPQFRQYVFETIASLIRYMSDSMEAFEGMLFPIFHEILESDIVQFHHYVFQLLAHMLNRRSSPIPDSYDQWFESVLSASMWSNASNIPAMTRLLCSFIRKCSEKVSVASFQERTLGAAQNLLSFKAYDHFGFEILRGLVDSLPFDAWSGNFPMILQILFTRLQEKRTPKFIRELVIYFASLVNVLGAEQVVQAVDGLQPGLFVMVGFEWVRDLHLVTDEDDRKRVLVGCCKLLTDSSLSSDDSSLEFWGTLLDSALSFAGHKSRTSGKAEDDEREELIEYEPGFAELRYAMDDDTDPFPDITNVEEFFTYHVAFFVREHFDKLSPVIEQLVDVDRQSILLERIKNL